MSLVLKYVKSVGKASLVLFLASAAVIAANLILTFTVTAAQEDETRLLEERVSGLKGVSGSPFEQAVSDIEVFTGRMPNKSGLPKALASIFDIARKNGLNIPSGDYAPETVSEAGISKYTISFPVEGSYPEIKKFIYGIENMNVPVVVEDIVFSRSKGTSRPTPSGVGAPIELKIRLSVYFI